MKKNILISLYLSLFCLILTSCKNEFEKIRASGDVNAMMKKALEYYDKGEYQKAQTLFELVMPSIKGRPELEGISYKYAYTHFYDKTFTTASFYFKNFATTFANSPLREEAEYMSAFSEYKQSPTHRLDQESSSKAIDGFQTFVNNFPESKRVKDCNKLIDELRKKLELKAYEEGELYFKIERYQAAVQVFENLLRDYPETASAESVRFTIVKAQYLLAENSVYEKQAERYKLVVEKYKDFVDKYPKSKFTKDAEIFLKNSNNKIKELGNVRYQVQSPKS
jgi:outer membrane protein assembly factor BamD